MQHAEIESRGLRIWGPLGHTLVHAIAAVLVIAILLFVAPRVERIFKDLAATLPVVTIKTLEASRLVNQYWYAVFPLVFVDGLILFALSQLPGRAAGLATVYSLLLMLTAIAASALLSLSLTLPFVALIEKLS